MSNYNKIYDQILARRETRATTTLTMVTIASSASLLLLIFYLDIDESIKRSIEYIPIMGIAVPFLALIYREITYYYIHRNDNEILNAIALKDVVEGEREFFKNSIIQYNKFRPAREFLLKLLFVFPLFGWFLNFDSFLGSIMIFITMLFIIGFSLNSRNPEKNKFPESELPDFLKVKNDNER